MSWEITVRFVVAMILGGSVGIEREYRSKDAGFRTHFLVALGSALFTVVSMYGFPEGSADPSRVAAQIVSGIGFLGAGTIIFQRNFIRGLTTAAGLWVTAAIGMACGTGNYTIAVVTTVLVLVGLEFLNSLISPIGTSHIHVAFRTDDLKTAKNTVREIKTQSKAVYNYNFDNLSENEKIVYHVSMDVKMNGRNPIGNLMELLRGFDKVSVNKTE